MNSQANLAAAATTARRAWIDAAIDAAIEAATYAAIEAATYATYVDLAASSNITYDDYVTIYGGEDADAAWDDAWTVTWGAALVAVAAAYANLVTAEELVATGLMATAAEAA